VGSDADVDQAGSDGDVRSRADAGANRQGSFLHVSVAESVMAGDWIKMRVDLYRDPKVCVMADNLLDEDGDLARYVDQNCQSRMNVTRNVTRNATVGALVTVWGVMRHRGKRENDDLVCSGVSLTVLDDISDLPGFGSAMESVGWVRDDGNRIVFPCFFEEYNVDPQEKKSASAAARQRRYRENLRAKSDANRDVTRDVTVTHRIEKRRVKNPIPLSGCDAEFKKFWSAYPRKVGREAALKAFVKIHPDADLLETILAAVKIQAASEQWQREAQFIPHAATWLNGKRWQDDTDGPGFDPLADMLARAI
jgi:hypothetical protein